jgi:hypothetical protein
MGFFATASLGTTSSRGREARLAFRSAGGLQQISVLDFITS